MNKPRLLEFDRPIATLIQQALGEDKMPPPRRTKPSFRWGAAYQVEFEGPYDEPETIPANVVAGAPYLKYLTNF